MEFYDKQINSVANKVSNKDDKIYIRKKYSKFIKEIEKNLVKDNCMICNSSMKSACNSHSIPRFILENISEDGLVTNVNLLNNLEFLDNTDGLKKAGTFRLICRDCDNTVFKEYETPDNYYNKASKEMLAQIALKNNLCSFYTKEKSQKMNEFVDNIYQANIENMDLIECRKEIEYAKKACRGKNNGYYAFYDKELNYSLPVAFQGSITLCFDLEGNVINNIFNLDFKKEMRQIEIAILPFTNKTRIIMFIKNGVKTYRRFYKQFNKLNMNEQLHTLFYMIILYSEFVFYDPKIENDLLKYKNISEASNRLPIISSFVKPSNLDLNTSEVLLKAKEWYDLQQRHKVPNLFLQNE